MVEVVTSWALPEITITSAGRLVQGVASWAVSQRARAGALLFIEHKVCETGLIYAFAITGLRVEEKAGWTCSYSALASALGFIEEVAFWAIFLLADAVTLV